MLRIARSPRMSPLALAMVVLVHVGVLAGMASLRQAPVEPPVPMVSALMVDVIRPQVEPRKVTPVVPPKPVPVQRQARSRPVPVPQVLSTQSQAAQAPEVPKATPPTQPAPTTPVAQGVPVAVAAAAAPPATTAPRFDADYLDNPKPAYPPLSRRANEQGKVVLKVLVEPSGAPSQVEVRTSSGFERLDKSAVAAVSRWKFIPAKQGTEVVSAWVAVPIVFSLKD